MTTILSIFLSALIIAYVLEPIANGLQRLGCARRISALLSVALGVTAALGLIVLFLNILQREIPQIKAQAPGWIEKTRDWLAPQLERFNLSLDWIQIKALLVERITQQFSSNANTLISTVLETLLASTQTLLAAVASLVLIFFVVFYLLVDWAALFTRICEFIPRRYRTTAQDLGRECDQLLSQYLRGQLLVMVILAVYYASTLSLLGMAGGLAIGLLTGLAIFIPYIGFGVGLTLAMLSALLQFGPGTGLLGVIAIYGVGQLIESFFLTPKLVGERIGLHPVAVVFALLFFGSLFGFFGVLLALPAAAVTLVALRHARAHFTAAE
ncbi:MAG: AI-2E family transporter [Burkholderiales bacterium]|jgi:predicted PurR-regulated permease PerM